MRELSSEKREMSAVEFCQANMRDVIAPPSMGSTKERIRSCARRLGWTFSRARDVWYADPRIAIKAEEVRDVEEATGLDYGRQELRTTDDLIRSASALLEGQDEDFYRAFVVAMVEALRVVARARNQRT